MYNVDRVRLEFPVTYRYLVSSLTLSNDRSKIQEPQLFSTAFQIAAAAVITQLITIKFSLTIKMSQIIELEVGWNKLKVDGIDRLEVGTILYCWLQRRILIYININVMQEMVENRNQEDPKLFSLPEWPELYTLEFLL